MLLLFVALDCVAQGFFNLTAQEVRIDSMLPRFTYAYPIGSSYADSTYSVEIEYPEFIDMSEADIERYHAITQDSLPEMPSIDQAVAVSRKKGSLEISFVPLVFREGKYKKLVSFKLTVKSSPRQRMRKVTEASARYADHSVLASGTWAKIRVPESGIYQLTETLIKQAGFTDINKVKIYGYGGELQPEKLDGDYLADTDDLKELATCTVNGRRLFYAKGPVSWESATATVRTRNPYSDYGYYFLTESDETPLSVDSAAFAESFYPAPEDYHSLYEVDGYSWYPGGRNLFDTKQIATGDSASYTLTTSGGNTTAQLSIGVTAGTSQTASYSFDGTTVGTLNITGSGDYTKGSESKRTSQVNTGTSQSHTVTLRNTSGSGPVRLDYLSLTFSTPRPMRSLSTESFSAPEYLYRITNQDHHADTAVDMVILIPTNQNFKDQAERLKAIHEEKDSMRVRIVPADELYNEFSSGTPDANAYRRYLKMLYDRAETEADMPRYLVLFGDCAWDNRMLTSEWSGYDPDDFLLCFESDNSFSEIYCYVSDDFFCLLDDGEGAALTTSDKPDVAVGRFPVRTDEQAKTMVDKTISYMNNENAGQWQNVVCMMGDDGNNNMHMSAADSVARMIAINYPAVEVKKVMWDAYTRVSSATGNTYPEVTKLLTEQMRKGALLMNYNGHGRADCISHEQVLKLNDFKTTTSKHLPLWVTASCDIMAFDGQTENIGEEALFNQNGGAVAFFGTTRTVYSNYNLSMNVYYTRYVLGTDDNGRRISVGEASRLAKNSLINDRRDLTTNKLQYSLLGDPALVLALPTLGVSIDSINGQPLASTVQTTIKAGETVNVVGHITQNGQKRNDFDGVMTATVRDVEQTVTCRLNDTSEDGSSWAFTYNDRPNVLFNGSDSVSNGRFAFSFSVPTDISYDDGAGLINVYAVSNDLTEEANGQTDDFLIGGSDSTTTDSIGPSIYCYLNSPSFVDGGNVNSTPYFVAELTDEDGINVTGNGIGHDLQLIIDGEMSMTYTLNDYFTYDFGSYQSGTVEYSIPELSAGAHTLLFRAWDVYNNSSTATLHFNVVSGLTPECISVSATQNPATTSTTFIITHDRAGSELTVALDIFDTSGRQLWEYSETGTPTTGTYTLDWDLTTSGGRKLPQGVYLYRIRLSSDGSSYSSKAKKIIIL